MGGIAPPNIAQDAMAIAQAPQNALQEYARTAQLQQETSNLAQQQQERALQMEAQRRQLADQDALTKTIAQYDPQKYSLGDIPKLVTQNGGSGQAALQAQQGLIAQKQNYLKYTDEQFAQELKKSDLTKGVHDEVTAASPEMKQAVYSQGLMTLARAGVDVSQEPPQYPGDDAFAQHLKPIMLHSQLLAEVQKDRELTVKEQEEANKEWHEFPTMGVALNTQTGETKSISGKGIAMSPAMLENKYLETDMQIRRGEKVAADDKAFHDSYEKMKTLGPRAQIALQGGLLSDAAKEMAANYYQQTGALPAGMRSPAMSAGILNQAAGAQGGAVPDIAANKRTYAAQTALQKSATSGDIAKNVTAYNTAIAHAQQLQEATNALDNGDVRGLNAIGNRLGYEFGSDKTTNFNVIKNALSGEISKVFKGGEATDAEIKAVQEPFSAANSPAQLRGAINNAIHLMNSKRDALQQQYEQGMKGQPNFGGQNQGGGQTGGAEGRTATGPGGHKIVVRGGRWVDAQTGAPIQ